MESHIAPENVDKGESLSAIDKVWIFTASLFINSSWMV